MRTCKKFLIQAPGDVALDAALNEATDIQAFSLRIYNLLRERVRGVVSKLLEQKTTIRDHPDTKDIVNEVFFALLDHRPGKKGKSPQTQLLEKLTSLSDKQERYKLLTHIIWKYCYYQTLSYLCSSRAYQLGSSKQFTTDEHLIDRVAAPLESEEEEDSSSKQAILEKVQIEVLRNLSEHEKDLIRLHDVVGMTFPDIAASYRNHKYSSQQLKQRYHRAKKKALKLQKQLLQQLLP